MFRDIYIFSAFLEAALLGTTMGRNRTDFRDDPDSPPTESAFSSRDRSLANPTGKSHSELSAGEWDFQIAARKRVGARGEHLVVAARVAARAARRPSPSPTRRREWEARHYRARATSCGVPSYKQSDIKGPS